MRRNWLIKMKERKGTSILVNMGLAAVILVVWECCVQSGIWSSYILPSPVRVLKTFWEMAVGGELLYQILISSRRVLLGFVCAIAAVLFCEAVGAISVQIHHSVWKVVRFLQNVPALSIVPLLILWSGIGELTKVIFIAFGAFFPIYINCDKGLYGCDKKLLEVGQMFRFTKKEMFLRIVLPSAARDILTGLKIGLGYSWKAIVGAEMVAAASGLGYMILDAQYMARTDKILVGITAIGCIGYVFDRILTIGINKLFWEEEVTNDRNPN